MAMAATNPASLSELDISRSSRSVEQQGEWAFKDGPNFSGCASDRNCYSACQGIGSTRDVGVVGTTRVSIRKTSTKVGGPCGCGLLR